MLRPNGSVWIWWSPWRNPWGHHLRALLPLPWIHLIFPEHVIFEACARVYESPEFIPRVWDREEQSGRFKGNKWRGQRSFSPFLNKLSRRDWEHLLHPAGFRITRRETHGFSGGGLRRAARLLARFPRFGECFVSFFIYELKLTDSGPNPD